MSLKRFTETEASIPRDFEFNGFRKTDKPKKLEPNELGRIAFWLLSQGWVLKAGVRSRQETAEGLTAEQLYGMLDMSYFYPDPKDSNGHIMGPYVSELPDGSLEIAVGESALGLWQRIEKSQE